MFQKEKKGFLFFKRVAGLEYTKKINQNLFFINFYVEIQEEIELYYNAMYRLARNPLAWGKKVTYYLKHTMDPEKRMEWHNSEETKVSSLSSAWF